MRLLISLTSLRKKTSIENKLKNHFIMKKLVLALTCIATLTLVVACGNNPKKAKEAKEEKQEVAAPSRVNCKDVNVDNFAEAIKTNTGVDYKFPDDWKAVSASGSEGGMGRTIDVVFGQQPNDVDVARAFFEKTKAQTRTFYEQTKESAAEFYVNKWSEFLNSSLEDHPNSVVGYKWQYLIGPFDDVTVYFFTNPARIRFEMPKAE